MLTATAHKLITLDELATEKLSARLVAAIDAATVEIWRRQALNDPREHSEPRSGPPPTQRILPVVVLGQFVVMPVTTPYPVVLLVDEGKSYRAMREVMQGDGEVLLVFVSEAEIAGFRSDAPQPLPQLGVIARVAELGAEPVNKHRIKLEGVSRAEITARLDHAPIYRAACIPHPDPHAGGPEVDVLLRRVKTWVEPFVKQTWPEDAPSIMAFVNSIGQPGYLADACAYGPMFSFEERLALLRTLDPVERLRMVARKLGT